MLVSRPCPAGKEAQGHLDLVLRKDRYGDLLADLDFVRIRDIACSGNVGIVVGRPVEAVADLREVVATLDAVALIGSTDGDDFVVQVGVLRVDLLDDIPYPIGDHL